MSVTHKKTTPIKKQTTNVLIGCLIFILMGLLNLFYRMIPIWDDAYQFVGYVVISITSIGLIFIGIGLRNLTDVYFVDHITKAGQQAATWIYIYAGAFLLDMITLGFPLVSGFVGMAILAGRVMAYMKINKLFDKIKRIFNLKIGSVFYILFAYYAIIVMVLGVTANYAADIEFEVYLAVFNGVIESFLMIAVGIKLVIDIYRLKEFVEKENIQPYSQKRAFLTRDRTDKPVLAATKEHVQSRTQIARLQEKTRTSVKKEVPSVRYEPKQLPKKTKIEIQFINCSSCNERTDKILEFCMNCGEKLQDDKKTISKMSTEISVKRTLSPTKEKILQQITIAIFLVAFVTYAFVTRDFSLTIYAWVIIAIFVTYILVNYIVLFFSGEGYAVTTVITDIAFLLVIIPVLCTILSYFIMVIVSKITEIQSELFRWLTIALSISLSLLCMTLMFRYRVKSTNMNLREYIRYRLDFKARAEELENSKERVEKKRADFDKLDRIEVRIAKQREENVMDYEDFDFKQRLKDLGSPLDKDKEE